jgi:hypothetical protein
MILISLKDGKRIKLDSSSTAKDTTVEHKSYNLRPMPSLNPSDELASCGDESLSVSFNSDSESNFDASEMHSTSGSSTENKKKRQRLTHLSAEEKLMRRKLKNRVAAQSARDRKKVRMDELEESVKVLRSQNEQLKKENSLLKEKTRALIEENQRLKRLAPESSVILPVVLKSEVESVPSLKRKQSELKFDLEVDESAVFVSRVVQQKQQLQKSTFQQLVYVLIMYTINLIKMNNSQQSMVAGVSKSFSFLSQQKREQMTRSCRALVNLKLKKTLLKLINLLRTSRHRQVANNQLISIQHKHMPPPTLGMVCSMQQSNRIRLSKLLKQLRQQSQPETVNHSKSFNLIILISLIESLMKKRI